MSCKSEKQNKQKKQNNDSNNTITYQYLIKNLSTYIYQTTTLSAIVILNEKTKNKINTLKAIF